MKTIRVRILVSLATMTRTYEKGDVTDWESEDAQRLFKAGYAEPIQEQAASKR